jgi:hypothetical protein
VVNYEQYLEKPPLAGSCYLPRPSNTRATHTLKAQCMTMHYVMQLALESEGKNVAAVIPLPE